MFQTFYKANVMLPRPCVRTYLRTSTCTLSGVVDAYKLKVSSGQISYNEAQMTIVNLMDKLNVNITEYSSNLVTKKCSAFKKEDYTLPVPKGLYLYGSVGTGKTMLMDLFYHTCPVIHKKRVHFHKFCLDVHKRIHIFKKDILEKYGREINLNLSSERDAITQVAIQISNEATLLCFDEFQITDIADALIMKSLFYHLWSNGVILIATSNRPPDDLYKDGLNREYFLPFIQNLQTNCIIRMIKSETDHRLLSVTLKGAYFTPVNNLTYQLLWESFTTSSSTSFIHSPLVNRRIPVMMNRYLIIPFQINQSCFFSFSDLCEVEKGAADYKALCENFKTIYLHGIPVMNVINHDSARRFITLVDEIYDAGVQLVWTSERAPHDIFDHAVEKINDSSSLGTDHTWNSVMPTAGTKETVASKSLIGVSYEMRMRPKSSVDINQITKRFKGRTEEIDILEGELASVQELSFAFKRAASRMIEMSSEKYIKNASILLSTK